MLKELTNWFQLGKIPTNIVRGDYEWELVLLSYTIAVLASYITFNMVIRLRSEQNKLAKIYWLFVGAFSMGSAIWSTHFISMLDFTMPITMEYELHWTLLSLLLAIFFAGLALIFLLQKRKVFLRFAIEGGIIGIGLAVMQYVGVQAMESKLNIHYLPGYFIFSIILSIVVGEMIIWLSLLLNIYNNSKQLKIKLVSSLVMGIAISSMNHAGMAACIFTPNLAHITNSGHEIIQPAYLAYFIAAISGVIIILTLTSSAVTTMHDVAVLKRNEKLKRDFISIVSHELRTPLTSIRGSLALLVSGALGEFNEKAKKMLDIANSNCDRLLILINDILDVEKIETGKMQFHFKVINLIDLIEESIDANKLYAEKFNIKVEFVKTIEKIMVEVDPNRLMQVLSNLISNACKFSLPGEKVIIRAKKLDSIARVSVFNTGEGIPLEFQPHIFQKFSQADSSNTRAGGSGLGLNISKDIIEKLKGKIYFKSTPNKGTRFYFELPVVNQGLEC